VVPVAHEQLVLDTEPITDPICLTRLSRTPGLDQAHDVGLHAGQHVLDPGLALLPWSVPAPDVPGHDPHRRVDQWTVRRIGIEAHAAEYRGARTVSVLGALGLPHRSVRLTVRGHEKVPADGQLRSPLVATRGPRWWRAEVSTPR
jgi:hypothetical protein